LSAKQEASLQALGKYLPEGTLDKVLPWLTDHKIHLTITRERQTVLGDYRQPDRHSGHRISINGNLNKYAFLLTLLHEIAHMDTFLQFGSRVASHGKEWKKRYADILKQFTGRGYLPHDVEIAVGHYVKNPAASSCGDDNLFRVLKKYDPPVDGHCFVEDLAEGALFKTKDGRVFRRGMKIRKRYKCLDLTTKREYFFSPVYEVEKVKGAS